MQNTLIIKITAHSGIACIPVSNQSPNTNGNLQNPIYRCLNPSAMKFGSMEVNFSSILLTHWGDGTSNLTPPMLNRVLNLIYANGLD